MYLFDSAIGFQKLSHDWIFDEQNCMPIVFDKQKYNNQSKNWATWSQTDTSKKNNVHTHLVMSATTAQKKIIDMQNRYIHEFIYLIASDLHPVPRRGTLAQKKPAQK